MTVSQNDPQILIDLKEMDKKIREIKQKVQHLLEISGGIQCVNRNSERMLASIKMLELNILDVVKLFD